MTINPSRLIETLRDKLETGERGHEADRDILFKFSNKLFLLNSVYSDHRHEKLLRHCVRMSEEAGPIGEILTDKDATERVLSWVNRTYDNEETNRDYRSAIRVFATRVTDSDEPPESVAWVPTGTSKSYDPAPNPADMLDWERDVVRMVERSHNPRDKALIALAFDAGPRSQELQNLTVGDVTASELGLRIALDGKTGQRSVTLVPSVSWVEAWRFKEHPRKNDLDAPLWCKLSDGDALSYRAFLDIFKAAGKRAEVTKPVTPTNFRKSNASWLARKGASSHLIEDRQGRSRGSKVASRYVARFGDAESTRYAALHGMDVEIGEGPNMAPRPCPSCDSTNPPHALACEDCGQALEPGAAEATSQFKSLLRQEMVRSEASERRAQLLELLETVEGDPATATDLIDEAMAHFDSSESESN